jgi:hypothetical protein
MMQKLLNDVPIYYFQTVGRVGGLRIQREQKAIHV